MSDQYLHFEYPSSGGDILERRLVNWIDHPTYFFGFCVLTGGPKSFSKRKVATWLADPTGMIAPPPPISVRKPRTPDILFTGFPKAQRSALETEAMAAGFLVRSTVSKNLSVIVAGPNAGWAKLAAAGVSGADVISIDDCPALFTDGALP